MTNEQAQLQLLANLQKIKEGKKFFYNLGNYLSWGLVEMHRGEVKISKKGLMMLEAAVV